MVERVNSALPISQQCRLLALPRSSVYRKPAEVSAEDLAIMALIDRHYLARPYYGSRRMAAWLATQGHHVNRKRVQRLMRLLGLAAIYQRPNTSKPVAAHKIYPYLLRGLVIDRVNQVWCSDITYIPMAKGFLYLVAILATLAQRNFHPASTVVSDGLHCFTGVSNAGCVHQPIVTGSGRKAALNPAFKWVNTTLGNIKSAITGTYRAILDKHVPRSLAEF